MLRTVAAVAAVWSAAAAVAADPVELPLWPATPPGGRPPSDAAEGYLPAEPGGGPSVPRLANVSRPTLTVYRPDAAANSGTAVVIAPGGGYHILAFEHEGTKVAEWLRGLGVTAAVLKYRVPRPPDLPADQMPVAPLHDAHRAARLVRHRAADWGVDPARVGALGVSAGGHLVLRAAGNAPSYPPADAADGKPAGFDFLMLLYPSYLTPSKASFELRPELKVSTGTPPTFVAVSADDPGPMAGSLALARALTEARGKVELHAFAGGGHGYGILPGGGPHARWPDRAADWLRAGGYLRRDR